MALLKRWRAAGFSLTIAAASLVMAIVASPASAQTNASWLLNPADANYNNGLNWSGGSAPTGTATFAASNQTNIDINTIGSVGGWTFNPGATTYQFNLGTTFSFNGAGIVVNAGSVLVDVAPSASLSFQNASTAGNASIAVNGGQVLFQGTSTAGNASIGITSGQLIFQGNSTAGNAAIDNEGGTVDFSQSTGPIGNRQLSVGPIGGIGDFFLGGNQLTVSTVAGTTANIVVNGDIKDGGPGGGGGSGASLVKAGNGALFLNGDNTYTGPTTVNGGLLFVEGSIAASSLTTVNNGARLQGEGTIGNTQINAGGLLIPGTGVPGRIMVVSGNLRFQSGAQYFVALDPSTASLVQVRGAPQPSAAPQPSPARRSRQASPVSALCRTPTPFLPRVAACPAPSDRSPISGCPQISMTASAMKATASFSTSR